MTCWPVIMALAACDAPDEKNPGHRPAGGPPTTPTPTEAGPMEPCAPVSTPDAAPLRQVGEVEVRQEDGVAHLVSLIHDPLTKAVVGVSSRAVVTFDITVNPPLQLGHLMMSDLGGGSWLGPGEVAVTSRNRGVWIVDVSRPERPRITRTLELMDAADAALVDDVLYVVTHTGALHAFLRPEYGRVGMIEGLAHPWKVARRGDHLYVADNALGLVPIDVRNSAAPVLRPPVPTAGGAQDVHVDGDHAYVALGAAGVEIYSLLDPDAPARVGGVDPSGSAASLWVADGLLWTANHRGVFVADVSDPSAPIPLGSAPTREYALAVASIQDYALVGDWSRALSFQVDRTRREPSLTTDPEELTFPLGTPARTLAVSNEGSAPLEVISATVEDARFQVGALPSPVASGASTGVEVSFADDGEPVETALCLTTNDPAAPVWSVPLRSTSSELSNLAVGQPAIDFVLPDLDGATHRLSEHLGVPVVLVYFATW